MDAEPDYVDGDPNAPLTRGEFQEALQLIAQSFDRVPTRAELKLVEARLSETLATKAELRHLEQRIVDQLQHHTSEVLRRLDGLAESVHRDVADTVRAAADKTDRLQQQHERRLRTLESKLGISAPN